MQDRIRRRAGIDELTPGHRRAGRRRIVVLVAASLVAAGLAVTTGDGRVAAAAAHTIAVSNRADDGSPTSLRAAIDQVNAGPMGDTWTIQLEGGGDPYVIDRDCQQGGADDNLGGDLDIVAGGSVVIETAPPSPAAPIEGEPPAATIAVGCAGERALDVHSTTTLVIIGLAITGGNTADGADADDPIAPNGKSGEWGGAIASIWTVLLLRSRFEANRTGDGGRGLSGVLADGSAGGFGGSGAVVATDGPIVVSGSTFRGNRTGRGGAGGSAVGVGANGGPGGFGGQAVLVGSSIKVESSLFVDNVLGDGGPGGTSGQSGGGEGGRGGSGAVISGSEADIVGTSFAGNAAGDGGPGGPGGAIGGDGGRGGVGGAISSASGLTLLMVTLDGNAAGDGGPGGSGPAPGAPGPAGRGGALYLGGANVIEFTTITDNRAGDGANIATFGAGTSLATSIVGDPQSGASCSGPMHSVGTNVFGGDASCPAATSDLVLPGALPLGPLADNGGNTRGFSGDGDPLPTRMPLPGGAIDGWLAVDACTTLPVDQRLEIKPSGGCEPGSVEVPVASATRYVPLPPTRVFDTRAAGPFAGAVPADGTITVPFAGVAGVPADATAVAFNFTLTQAAGPGFVTAYPAGSTLPLASNLNAVRAGQDVPNFVVVPLGAGGAVSFYTYAGGHLLADIAGYFVPAQVASAGRLQTEEPYRALDTRLSGNGLAPGSSLTVTLDGLDTVVPDDALAVVLNVTGTEADGAGYVTAYPSGQQRPNTSTINLDGPGHTAANMAIVPLGADGTITFFSDAGTELVVDVAGFVSGPSWRLSTPGLTVPLDPVRVFDTRSGGGGAPVPAGGTIDVATAGGFGIPTATDGVLLNVTAADSLAPGYVTSWPTGSERPVASTLNVTAAGEERANAALAQLGDGGAVSYYAETGTHLLADAFGYLVPFSGAVLPAP